MMITNFAPAGAAVALVATAGDFFPDGDLASAISKCAFFLSTTALMMGVGNLLWMPLVVKYGRRPVYLASFTLYLITVVWAACSYSYVGTLIARILMGVGAGSAETIAPLSIADVFFLHERGLVTA
jgi:MFS family permease